MFAVDYRNDPRGEGVRAAVVQEGYDTICTAPLFDGAELLGLLNVYHDRPHAWTEDDLETMAALATQASVAIRAAQDFERMATWAAQLGSIQQLGTRLNRLSSVHDIGMAIATELRQLIDYHNVRVYRIAGNDLIPVAMQGQVGEYVDETPDQLRVAVGEGITGWVAEHGVAQNLGDAANDPRADTIPGTEEDLDESMLLAPMIFDDQVLGVLVLSKLGLDQFTDDDLRLLVIYASFAAQAMANADTTARLREQSTALERQVQSQRELLQITESILTTLDSRAVLDSITERLLRLIACDNIAIEVVDPSTGRLTPLTARGVHAASYLEAWEPGETGIATWVVEHNEPTYVADERNDPRVNHFREQDTVDGSLIVVPLRGRDGAIGVLTIERLGIGNAFSTDEFELVQLFAAQVSIALQNAEVFQAVELRAQTDDLTGLLNHGTFEERLEWSVHAGSPFSLIMLDLDDFRDVNNSLGHQAGDQLLREIASELVRAGRDSDQIFRYGGDEFSFLLPGTDSAGARLVAERARQAVRATGRNITASIGIGTYPDDGSTAASVLLAADRACFVAKRGGRDRIATAAEGLALAGRVLAAGPDAGRPAESPHRLTRASRLGRKMRQDGHGDERPAALRDDPAHGTGGGLRPDPGQPAQSSARRVRGGGPADTGPDTCRPDADSVVRSPDPDPRAHLRALHGQDRRHARRHRETVQDRWPEHRVLEPRDLPLAGPGFEQVQAGSDRGGLDPDDPPERDGGSGGAAQPDAQAYASADPATAVRQREPVRLTEGWARPAGPCQIGGWPVRQKGRAPRRPARTHRRLPDSRVGGQSATIPGRTGGAPRSRSPLSCWGGPTRRLQPPDRRDRRGPVDGRRSGPRGPQERAVCRRDRKGRRRPDHPLGDGQRIRTGGGARLDGRTPAERRRRRGPRPLRARDRRLGRDGAGT